MVVEEIKQAISKPSGDTPTVPPELGEVAHQLPITELPSEISVSRSSQLASELPALPKSEFPNEVVSELPGELPDRRHALNAPLTEARVNDDALTAPSELLDRSLSSTPDGDPTLAEARVNDDALTAPSELLDRSLSSTPDGDSTLAEATVNDDALAPNNKKVAAQIPSGLTGAALARRLGVAPASISRNKNKENFAQWTSIHDPDGISWHFDGQTFYRVTLTPPPDVE